MHWGDHITIQAIADMLSVNITVLSSDHPAVSVIPGNCTATREVFVGLVMQFHYVGLDKMCDSSVEEETSQNAQTISEANGKNTDSHEPEAADNALDDATIEEGDEHRIQISGAPMASTMVLKTLGVSEI